MNPSFSFYDSNAPIYTRARFLPPSKLDNCTLKECLVTEGGIITSANISRSVVGLRSIIRQGTTITNSIIMGNDFYEDEQSAADKPSLGIGKNCRIMNAIIDKNVRIGDNVVISPAGVTDITSPTHNVRDEVIVIPKGAVIPSNSTIGIIKND
jgi:glucose-1-phosphate adenylyltransferase